MKKDLIEYDITTAAIAEMKKKYTGMKITDAKSDKAVRTARTFMVSKRTAVEKTRKELNEDANIWRKKVNDKAKEITALLLPIEEPLQAECKRIDDATGARREEKARVEFERIEEIQETIVSIRDLGITHGKDSSGIQERLTLTKGIEISKKVHQEFMPQAIEAHKAAIASLEKALNDRLQFEKEETDRKAEAERLEVQKKEQEAAQAKIDEEIRKVELAKAEIEEKKATETRRTERAEWERKAAIKAEEDAKENARQKAEEAEALAAVEAEEKERKAAMAPDREKLIIWIQNFNETALPSPVGLKSKKAQEILRIAKDQIEIILQDAMDKINKL